MNRFLILTASLLFFPGKVGAQAGAEAGLSRIGAAGAVRGKVERYKDWLEYVN